MTTRKNRNMSFQSTNLLENLLERNQRCFRLEDAYRLLPNSNTNTVRRLLSDMTSRGLLMRVKDGVYYIIPFEQDPDTFMPDWHLLAQYLTGDADYYIGYFSALQLHSLTTQPNLKEQIVVNKQIKPSTLLVKETPFQFIYHNDNHFFGHKKTWIDSFNKVICSDIEKTLVDCLFKPGYAGGITEIAKAIFKSKNDIDFSKLLEYTIQFNSQAVIKRLGFLSELLILQNPVIEQLHRLKTSSVVLLEPSHPKTGKICKRWSVQQNIDNESILSPIYS